MRRRQQARVPRVALISHSFDESAIRLLEHISYDEDLLKMELALQNLFKNYQRATSWPSFFIKHNVWNALFSVLCAVPPKPEHVKSK